MNREIKFRFWDAENKKFVQYGNGDYREWCIRTDGKVGWISKHGFLQDGERKLIPLQFTGLKDKNGKDLYEFDRVLDSLTGMICIVKFGHCKKYAFQGWYLENEELGHITMITEESDSWEIIGNVFELEAKTTL